MDEYYYSNFQKASRVEKNRLASHLPTTKWINNLSLPTCLHACRHIRPHTLNIYTHMYTHMYTYIKHIYIHVHVYV